MRDIHQQPELASIRWELVASGLWALVPAGIVISLLAVAGIKGALPSVLALTFFFWLSKQLRTKVVHGKEVSKLKETGLILLVYALIFLILPILGLLMGS